MNVSSKRNVFIAAILWIAAIFICVLYFSSKSRNGEAPTVETKLELRQDGKIRICFWNVKNYMETYRFQDKKRTKGPKLESEKDALVEILLEIRPDVLGIAEIGGAPNLSEFANILSEAGLNYPYHAVSEESAEHPQLGILSLLPFAEIQKIGNGNFSYLGEDARSPRGILFATFQYPNDTQWHFGVLHLKSRFGAKKCDPEFRKFRELEAEAFVKSLLPFLGKALIICGDFNDEIADAAPSLLEKSGLFYLERNKESKNIPTYIWEKENVSYIFDFFMAERKMRDVAAPSRIIPINKTASDHAPIYIDLDLLKLPLN